MTFAEKIEMNNFILGIGLFAFVTLLFSRYMEMISAMQKAKRKRKESENFERLAKQITWTEPTKDTESTQEDFSEKGKMIFS